MMVSIESCGVEFIAGATGPSQSAPLKWGLQRNAAAI